tara:strand:- start:43 stop:582 length:540 start_codon:yes stop_codon:yes gene_type:complete
MPDYSKSKIYKIVCNETGATYYGSTVQKVSERMGKHRSRMVCSSRQIIERGNYGYSLVEEFSCDTKEQLHARERWYIENNDCVNKQIPTRTRKEYNEANREKIQEQRNEYREANKEKIQEYYQANKEKIQEQKKEYYEANKEKIREKIRERVVCECGCEVNKNELPRHRRSKKHLALIN